ncbi:MAG: LURP-one-related family protein [Bacillota bacterium]|nr:LURP-one-related family protein [Bacillota bacterium]
MRYQVRQKIISIGDSYSIKDEMNNDKFSVKSEVFSFGHKLYLTSLTENETAYIEQKLLNFLPTYNIYLNGNYAARMRKELTFFTPRFEIESVLGNYSITGDILSHDFEILKNNIPVAQVSKAWISLSDTYGVDISDSENQAFILSLIIILDEVMYSNNN